MNRTDAITKHMPRKSKHGSKIARYVTHQETKDRRQRAKHANRKDHN